MVEELWYRENKVKSRDYIYYSCVVLILFYSTFKVSLYDAFKVIEPLFVLLVAYVFYKYSGFEKKTFPVIALYLSVAIVVVSWLLIYLQYPEYAHRNVKPETMARHFVFVFIAFLLAGNIKNILTYWFFALFGTLLIIWSVGDGFADVMEGIAGKRIDFGLQNAQHTAIIFSIPIIGLSVFFRRIMSTRYGYWMLLPWMLLISFFILIVIITQTRSAIVGLAVVFLLLFALMLYLSFRDSFFKKTLLLFVIVSLGIAVLAKDFLGYSYKRYANESVVAEKIMSGYFDEIPKTSMGYRVYSWKAGLEWFVERPLLGWGSKGGTVVMQNTEWLQDITGGRFGHMHSSYIEMLVRYGSIGFLLYFSLAIWAFYYTWKAWKAKFIPADFFIFFNLFFVFFAIVNVFESYMFFWSGTYLFNIVMAPLLSFVWKYMSVSSLKSDVSANET